MNKGGNMNFKERIINGLYGAGCGDSIGNPFEFVTNIDPDDVITYVNNTDRLVISDDQQMNLFGMEAIQDIKCYSGDIFQKVEQAFTAAYLDWYYTQTNDPECHRSFYRGLGLLSFDSMYSVQAPGYTCLSALKTLRDGGVVENDSCGCGSVMRLLPLVTLFDEYSMYDAIKCAQITGAITHKHEQNDLAIERYITDAYSIIHDEPLVDRYPRVTKIEQLGDGWTALSCVEMAIWAYSKAETFDELLKLTCSIDGDSDSVAAVAGTMWGLSGRYVPKKYIEKLDALDAIKYIVDRI